MCGGGAVAGFDEGHRVEVVSIADSRFGVCFQGDRQTGHRAALLDYVIGIFRDSRNAGIRRAATAAA
jgi:hypothetical protein